MSSPDTVRGERGATVVSRTRSLQSRLNGLLATALAVGIVIAMLAWYYSMKVHRRPEARAAVRPDAPAAGAMSPPTLGPIAFPHLAAPAEAPPPSSAASLAELMKAVPPASPPLPRAVVPGAAEPRFPLPEDNAVPADSALARRLSGAVFTRFGAAGARAAEADSRQPAGSAELFDRGAHSSVSRSEGNSGVGDLGGLMSPDVEKSARARLLPQQRLLLPKGAFIDCTLETAIDSTLPGMTSCITATDTFSADGTVVLLPRGTKLIGETRGEVRQGTARVFIIWLEARTSSGVIVPLDSPGTDALGRSGVTGKVNRHFWQRFGAALLVSGIDAAAQSGLQSGNGTVVVDPMASEQVLTGALRGNEDIRPTVNVPNGTRIQVLVARDIDFRSVYELIPRP